VSTIPVVGAVAAGVVDTVLVNIFVNFGKN
jgi:hypothetical protein